MATEFPQYTLAERHADAVVHLIGLVSGLAGCIALAATALPHADSQVLVSLGVYGAGLMAMLGCSALYNMTPEGARKRVFRRFDYAAIFLMIAGTYTPITLIVVGGAWGMGLLAFIWAVAAAGMALELSGLRRSKRLAATIYLLLGWTIVVASGPLSAALSSTGLGLLITGGVLYSLGTVFHLWTRLPYRNVVWHGFVIAAAACHYAAIFHEVASA